MSKSKQKFDIFKDGKKCFLCGKGPTSSYNRPHSLHKTKRVVKPNLQKFDLSAYVQFVASQYQLAVPKDPVQYICARCRRTLLK